LSSLLVGIGVSFVFGALYGMLSCVPIPSSSGHEALLIVDKHDDGS
jgi:hypothetical protein